MRGQRRRIPSLWSENDRKDIRSYFDPNFWKWTKLGRRRKARRNVEKKDRFWTNGERLQRPHNEAKSLAWYRTPTKDKSLGKRLYKGPLRYIRYTFGNSLHTLHVWKFVTYVTPPVTENASCNESKTALPISKKLFFFFFITYVTEKKIILKKR